VDAVDDAKWPDDELAKFRLAAFGDDAARLWELPRLAPWSLAAPPNGYWAAGRRDKPGAEGLRLSSRDDVSWRFELDRSGGRNVLAQHALGFFEDSLDLLLRQEHAHHG
jgi:hypothetical protein